MKKKILGLMAIMILVMAVGTSTNSYAKKKDKDSSMGFPQMMSKLSVNMQIWDDLNESEKAEAVSGVIGLYRTRNNVAILREPEFYIKQIDQTIRSNPTMRGMGIVTVMRILSVMEYDYYNGQNKDELAKEVLGEKMYEANKMRLRMRQR